MQERLHFRETGAEAMKALRGVEAYIRGSGLEPALMHLVRMRASQINGCAFCLDMHSRDARQHGETEQRLYLLNAWRESPLYSPRERAALAWTEAVTLIADTHAPDDVYDEVRAQFDDKQLGDLTVLIGMINLWNRLMIAFRGQYVVEARQAA